MIIIKDFKINPEYIENHPLSSKKQHLEKCCFIFKKPMVCILNSRFQLPLPLSFYRRKI